MIKINNLDSALEAANRLITLNPYEDGYRVIRAIVFDLLGRTKDSKEELYVAIKLNPLNEDAYINLTNLLINERNYDTVQSLLSELDISHSSALTNNLIISIDDHDKAVEQLVNIEKVDISGTVAYNIAVFLSESGNYKRALEYINIALKKDFKNSDFIYAKLFILSAISEKDKNAFIEKLKKGKINLSFLN